MVVLVTPRAFEEGMQAGALRRTRRAAETYAQQGDHDSASAAVFQTDPELSGRYLAQGQQIRERKAQRADQEYQAELAPMLATENYQGAIDLAGQRARPPAEILQLRQTLTNATTQQREAVQQQLEIQTRALVGIAELPETERQTAFAQWRSTLPAEALANVPEQYSDGYVRRRIMEALDLNDALTQRNAEAGLAERGRHNREMEDIARARAAGGGGRSGAPGSGPGGRYTEFQGTSAYYAASANNANAQITGRESDINWDEVWGAAAIGMGSPESRAVRQAMREFINALARRQSGAAIGRDEWFSYRQMYFPAPGDDPATLAQKRQTRDIAIRGLVGMSQGAAANIYPQMFGAGTPYADMIPSGGGGYAPEADVIGGLSSEAEALLSANPQDVEILRANPSPEARRYFDETYGEGASEWILSQ